MVNLSEKETRSQLIDESLKDAKWKTEYIKEEVNSIKSKFDKMDFKSPEDGIEKGVDHFIDYLLLDEHKNIVAIIEAKRFSIDPEKGSIQATTYQKDIESQTGFSVPIFLTNGKRWYLKEKGYPTREISGPFSQKDLQRRARLSIEKQNLSDIEINPKIVDRSKNIEIVKLILSHFEKGNKKALLNMATGTGKTRVAMAIIEALIRARYIQNVLFVVDRIQLGKQASDAFESFLRGEPKTILNEYKDFDMDKRMYVSTVQTLMAKDKEIGNKFQKFTPGFFDLIVFDEAHRSYYDKNNLIFKYFDAIKIGLTATPSKEVARDTYDLFDCERENPTLKYDYDETMVRISLMNLMMHGIKKPNIWRANTLSDSEPRIPDNMYDVVLANPPFKGSLNEAEISERFRIKTKKTELLFLELMYHALSPSGRCAVIVPEGVLFGNSKAHKQVREMLLTKCRLDAVISMPSGVFKPYSGVSTAVLFFTKGEPTQKVWFYKMESDGFSLDDKRTFIDGKGDVPDIIKQFQNKEKEKENNRKKKHFFVPVEEIKGNDWDLSISKYREIEYEEIEYEKPEVLKKKILNLEEDIIMNLTNLKV
jgi:hypothetical protein